MAGHAHECASEVAAFNSCRLAAAFSFVEGDPLLFPTHHERDKEGDDAVRDAVGRLDEPHIELREVFLPGASGREMMKHLAKRLTRALFVDAGELPLLGQ